MAVGKGSILRASNAKAKVDAKVAQGVEHEGTKDVVSNEEPATIKETKANSKSSIKIANVAKNDSAVKDKPTTKKVSATVKKETMKLQTGFVSMVPTKILKACDKITSQDKETIDMLEESIKKYGILEPLIVWTKQETQVMVIDGNKRLQAAKQAGIKEVPVFALDVKDQNQADERKQVLHSFHKRREDDVQYNVVSSIHSEMPVHLL